MEVFVPFWLRIEDLLISLPSSMMTDSPLCLRVDQEKRLEKRAKL
jgi:hypothetical protein